ncbi:MAG: sulfate reduction electron transfer complex DsrMKJOP subunit DsrO [Desulfobacterales bacterium]
MEDGRRTFLKVAGIAALGLGVKPALDAIAANQGHGAAPYTKAGANALRAKQWGMVVDTRKLTTAEAVEPLIEACHKTHNVPFIDPDLVGHNRHEIKWIWETHFHNAFPTIEAKYLSEEIEERPFLVLCNHCENPPCVRACPTKATWKREDGIVAMDFHRCIGCRFCMAACPFGARSFNYRDPRPFVTETNLKFPTRSMGVVEKCNFCAERLAEGLQPACVEASNGALVFGDLEDPESEIREVLRTHYTIRRKVSLGTGPAVYYIL